VEKMKNLVLSFRLTLKTLWIL